jgi:hypothetical protein
VTKGKLVLGQFQAIIAAELDGPRNRDVAIQIIGPVSAGLLATLPPVIPLFPLPDVVLFPRSRSLSTSSSRATAR